MGIWWKRGWTRGAERVSEEGINYQDALINADVLKMIMEVPRWEEIKKWLCCVLRGREGAGKREKGWKKTTHKQSKMQRIKYWAWLFWAWEKNSSILELDVWSYIQPRINCAKNITGRFNKFSKKGKTVLDVKYQIDMSSGHDLKKIGCN